MTSILGDKIDFPVGIGATGVHQMVHSDGELATARGTFLLATLRYSVTPVGQVIYILNCRCDISTLLSLPLLWQVHALHSFISCGLVNAMVCEILKLSHGSHTHTL